MVLYVKALKANVEDYMKVATILKRVLDELDLKSEGFGVSMENSRQSLAVLDKLLADGITELEAPQKK